jgi:hypothetical protein
MKWQIPAVFGTRSGTPTALGTRRFGLIEVQEGNNPGQFTAIGCGGINGDLHIVGIANYTDVWHTIRHADGSWQPAFGGVGSDQQGFPAVDCAGVGHDLHVVAIDGIDNGGPIWHTVRNADGTWQSGFDTVAGSLSFNYVACAGVGDELQVVGITSGGQLWHTIRHADGTWQEPFGLIQSQEANDPGHFLSVSCAGVGDELHLVGVAGGQAVAHDPEC